MTGDNSELCMHGTISERGNVHVNRMVVSWLADHDQTGTWGVEIDRLTLEGHT